MTNHDQRRTENALPDVDQELIRLEEMLEQSNTMEARHDYLLGMLIGVIGMIGLFSLAFLLVDYFKSPLDPILLGVAIAGSLGAIVSVMTRLTSGKLAVDNRAGRVLIRLSGGFRPAIGAIFGIAVFVFIAANLLPIDVKVVGPELAYFHLGIAFLAGFSERLAQDAITRISGVVSTANPDPS